MKLRRTFIAALLASAAIVGVASTPAESANALCPKVCLTGGLLGVGGSRVSILAYEDRTYEYAWTAIDLTEMPPISISPTITLHVYGQMTSATNWKGTGHAHVGDVWVDNVTLQDTGVTVTANATNGGETFRMQASILGGGVATYQTDEDHDVDGYYCGEC